MRTFEMLPVQISPESQSRLPFLQSDAFWNGTLIARASAMTMYRVRIPQLLVSTHQPIYTMALGAAGNACVEESRQDATLSPSKYRVLTFGAYVMAT